jgi:hypothetical protein
MARRSEWSPNSIKRFKHDSLMDLTNRSAWAVLRNKVVEKLTLPLPIHIRDASRRGLV